jgi:signal transduction histidine kinase
VSPPVQTDRSFPSSATRGRGNGPPQPGKPVEGDDLDSIDEPLLGPRYEFRAPLGEGGMSRVFRVLDRARDEEVALKILNDDSATTLGAEFRFIASLNHPGIISVHDFGLTPDGRPYFTMELVEGGDIVQFADAAPLRQTIQAVRGVFETLDFVHARGILHGDLKPANILMGTTLGGERFPRLLDFGIARMAEDTEQRLSGTVHYMAPELIVRRQRDRRTDLYAMGAVLYELLVGEVPFDGADAMVILRQHLKDPPRDPGELRAEVAGQLSEIVLRLLEKSPDDRFQRAREVAAALDAWLGATGEPAALPLARRSQPPGRRSTRPPPRGAPWVVAEPRVWLAGGARFVGRERELGQLASCALDLSPRSPRPNRTGALWLLVGQPGIGKTRLLQEMRVRAQLGGVGCLLVELERCRSSAEALQRLAATVAGAAGNPALLDEAAARLAEDRGPAEQGVDGSWAERETPRRERLIAVAERLASVCTQLAEARPIVLVLDHLDAVAEEAGTAFRSFCAAVVQAPVMLVAAGVTSESGPLSELATIPAAERIELGRLGREATGQIVRSLLGEMEGSSAIIDHVHSESGGNPGAVERVVRALVAAGAIVVRGDAWVVAAHYGGKLPTLSADAGLEQIAQSVLAELDPVEREVAEAAACVGLRFDAGFLREVMRQDPDFRDDPDLVLRGLTDLGVLESAIDEADLAPGSPRFRFAQRATRELLLRLLESRGSSPWSERIIAAFAARPEPTAPEELETLARHLLACGRAGEAAKIAARLVAEAVSSGLSTEAPDLLRAALGETPADTDLATARWCELACLLAEFERGSGSAAQAIRWYERVVQTGMLGPGAAAGHAVAPGQASGAGDAPAEGMARLLAGARRELGDLLMERGAEDGESTLVQALQEARDLGDPRLVGQAAYTLANRLMLAGRHDEAARGLGEALDVAERGADRQLRARSLKLRAMLHWYRGEPSQAEADAREAAREYQSLGSPHGAAVSLGVLGNAFLSSGRLEQAAKVFRDTLEHARAARWLTGIGKSENGLALIAFHSDDWDGACEHWRASLAIADRTGNCVEQVILINNLGFVAALRGEHAAAASLYGEALSLARRATFRKGEALVLGNLGELDMAMGQLAEARGKLTEALGVARAISAKDQEIECERRMLEVDLETPGMPPGQVAEAALRLLGRAEADEVAAEVPHLRRVAGAALARSSAGDDAAADEAARLLEEAAQGFEQLGSRFEAARVVALAAGLFARGLKPAERQAQGVGGARKLFRRMRAQPEIDRLRAAMTAVGHSLTGTIDLPPESIAGPPARPSLPPESLRSLSSLRPTLDRELQELLDALRGIGGTLDLDPLLARIVDEAVRLTRAERGFVVLCDRDGKPIVRVSRGTGGTDLDDEEIRASRTVMARVIAQRQACMIEDVAALGPEFLGKSVARMGIGGMACVPLEVGTTLVGLLYVDASRGGQRLSQSGLGMLGPYAAHAAVAISNARQLEQHERRAELLANGAHELVNPLRAILGYSRMLQVELGGRPASAAAHASIVQDQATRLSRMVSGLIDLADTEPGRISWTAVSVQVKDLIETAAEQIRPLAAMRDIALGIDIPHRVPTVFGSRDRLIQAMANLLATAVGLSEGARVLVTARGFAPDPARAPTLPPPRPQSDPLLPEPETGWELSHEAPVRIDVTCEAVRRAERPSRGPSSAPPGQGVAEARRAVLAQIGHSADGAAAEPGESSIDPGLRIAQRVVEHHGGLLWAEELSDGTLRLSMLFPSLVQKEQAEGA